MPRELLARMDRVNPNRSAFVELADRACLAEITKHRRESRDRRIIQKNADRLNAEAMDVLGYQRFDL